jgi:hypothetical protein
MEVGCSGVSVAVSDGVRVGVGDNGVSVVVDVMVVVGLVGVSPMDRLSPGEFTEVQPAKIINRRKTSDVNLINLASHLFLIKKPHFAGCIPASLIIQLVEVCSIEIYPVNHPRNPWYNTHLTRL